MKFWSLTLTWLFFALQLSAAQTVTLAWDQPQAVLSLPEVQAYAYSLIVNAAAPLPLVATCVAPVAPATAVSCTAPAPAFVGSAQTLVLRVTDPSGLVADSAPLVVKVPSAATGLKIKVVITVP